MPAAGRQQTDLNGVTFVSRMSIEWRDYSAGGGGFTGGGGGSSGALFRRRRWPLRRWSSGGNGGAWRWLILAIQEQQHILVVA